MIKIYNFYIKLDKLLFKLSLFFCFMNILLIILSSVFLNENVILIMFATLFFLVSLMLIEALLHILKLGILFYVQSDICKILDISKNISYKKYKENIDVYVLNDNQSSRINYLIETSINSELLEFYYDNVFIKYIKKGDT